MGKVRVETMEVDGMLRAVAIPEEDATAEDWHLAWMEVRKLRDKVGPKGMWRARLAVNKRLGDTWGDLVEKANSIYVDRLYIAVKTNDPQAKYAMSWLKYLGIERDSIQVEDDFEVVAKVIEAGKWSLGFRLLAPPATLANIRGTVRPILEEIDKYLEGMEETG